MSPEILLILGLLSLGLLFFALELLPIEVTALSILGVLMATGIVTVEQAISGFSNQAVIAIACLLVLSHALTRTGLLAVAAERLADWAGQRYWLGVGTLLLAVALLSGVLNNTAVVAIFIPLVLDFCKKQQISPSKLLLPLSYASIFGGTLTLIGTSTNLLVSSIAEEAGQPPFGMFEFLPVGIVFLVVGLSYTLLAGPRLLPGRVPPGDATENYGLGAYFSEIRVQPESPLVGQNLRESRLGERFAVTVLGIVREDEHLVGEIDRLPLAEGDLLIVQAEIDDLLKLRRDGLSLLPDVKLSPRELEADGIVTAEVLVAPRSTMVGRTLRQTDFRQRYGGFVMAIRRHSETLRNKVSQTVLAPWDALLTLIPRPRLLELRKSDDVIVLTELPVRLRRRRFWWVVVLLLPLAILLAAVGVFDITSGAMLAVIVLLLLRVLSPEEAYGAVHWQVVVLIAAFVPVGQAALETGASDLIASLLVQVADLLPLAKPYAVLALVYLATSLLTQVISNAAAAIILTPVALSLATQLHVDPRAFLMAVCFAASAEFMTPVGYQTNLMVYSPGGYRFLDYTRFGAPLNLAFWLLAIVLLPRVWPF